MEGMGGLGRNCVGMGGSTRDLRGSLGSLLHQFIDVTDKLVELTELLEIGAKVQ